jgi:hypothetical protein
MTIEAGTEELSAETRIYRASEAIRAMGDDMGDDMNTKLFPGNPALDALRSLARDAPLRTLAVAFVLGMIVARRR